MYDWLIVGSGLFGATVAHHARAKGLSVCILEKRNHIGGNCYTYKQDGIDIHRYGPHIFNTNNEKVWQFVNQFATFNNFRNSPKVSYENKIYSFPINLMTIYQIFGVRTPDEAEHVIECETRDHHGSDNLEEWCLSEIGPTLYKIFIKGYTQKQWGRDPKDLPASIIKRLPIRMNYNDNYYNTTHQGIPTDGYTSMIRKMTHDCVMNFGIDFLKDKYYWETQSTNILYTGPIDAYYNYAFGELEYRSLRFETTEYRQRDFQGNAVINYTQSGIGYTRIIEHKHFNWVDTPTSWITREYPVEWKKGQDPYYPIPDEKNIKRYNQYKELNQRKKKTHFGGRLAEYKYYNMDAVVAKALSFSERYV